MLGTSVPRGSLDIQKLNLKQMPSIDEGIKWATYLQKNFTEINEDNIDYTICMLAKNNDDVKEILKANVVKKNIGKQL